MPASDNQISTPAKKAKREHEKECFVVMPYGQKEGIDFDAIYRDIIEKAFEDPEINLSCRRSDDSKEAGLVHREMIRSLIDADVVIVDITLSNPNVFYELGIRHSLRRSTTVVVRNAAVKAPYPFNIAGMRAIEYDTSTPEKIAESIRRLKDSVKASFSGKDVDSLVHTLFNDILITRNAPPIMEQDIKSYEVKQAPGHYLGFITGDIARVTRCEAWVNAENTKMEMGRLHDDSISATIRFYGAKRNDLNEIVYDNIREELLCQCDLHKSVEPGTVLVTTPGELATTNKVKVILHVAALHGEPAKGYLPIRDYPGCILRVLDVVEALNKGTKKVMCLHRAPARNWLGRRSLSDTIARPVEIEGKIRSIVIPLFGSRTTGQHPQDVADQLYRAACVYFEQNPTSTLQEIYFLAYTYSDKQFCEAALASLNRGRAAGRYRISTTSVQDAMQASADDDGKRPVGPSLN